MSQVNGGGGHNGHGNRNSLAPVQELKTLPEIDILLHELAELEMRVKNDTADLLDSRLPPGSIRRVGLGSIIDKNKEEIQRLKAKIESLESTSEPRDKAKARKRRPR